nr:MAG TPA: hypothetical protein [Caudoviricetes sp.]
MIYQVGGMSVLLSLWMSLDVHNIIVPYWSRCWTIFIFNFFLMLIFERV